MSAQQALEIYVERGERIFPSRRGVKKWQRILRWLIKSSRSLKPKKQLLHIFGDKAIDQATKRLVIPRLRDYMVSYFLQNPTSSGYSKGSTSEIHPHGYLYNSGTNIFPSRGLMMAMS